MGSPRDTLPEDLKPVSDKVTEYFLSRAPKSLIRFRKHPQTFGGTNDIYTIDCWLIKRDADLPNRIRGNDPFTFHLTLEDLGEGQYSLYLMSMSLNFSIKPEKEFLVMSHRKVPFRKSKGDAAKMEKNILRAMSRYLDSYVKEQKAGNLYHQEYETSYPVR